LKTINDLFILGRTDPVVHSYIKLYERKEITIEQALIGIIFTLAEQKNEVVDKYTNHLQQCPTPNIQRRST
jgi:hypothetical protein